MIADVGSNEKDGVFFCFFFFVIEIKARCRESLVFRKPQLKHIDKLKKCL